MRFSQIRIVLVTAAMAAGMAAVACADGPRTGANLAESAAAWLDPALSVGTNWRYDDYDDYDESYLRLAPEDADDVQCDVEDWTEFYANESFGRPLDGEDGWFDEEDEAWLDEDDEVEHRFESDAWTDDDESEELFEPEAWLDEEEAPEEQFEPEAWHDEDDEVEHRFEPEAWTVDDEWSEERFAPAPWNVEEMLPERLETEVRDETWEEIEDFSRDDEESWWEDPEDNGRPFEEDAAMAPAVTGKPNLCEYRPGELLILPDREMLGDLAGLVRASTISRRLALSSYLSSLGSEALAYAACYEEVTGEEVQGLADDLSATAAFLASYRLYAQGGLTMEEAVEELLRSVDHLSPRWVDEVRRIASGGSERMGAGSLAEEDRSDRGAPTERTLVQLLATATSWSVERWTAVLGGIGFSPVLGVDWRPFRTGGEGWKRAAAYFLWSSGPSR